LPEPRQREVEGRRGIDMREHEIRRKRGGGQKQYNLQDVESASPGKSQHQWPQEIELLLDSQRPQMQERLKLRGGGEVAGFPPE